MSAHPHVITPEALAAGQRLHPTAVQYVDLPTPALGGKAWLLQAKGTFVLERGPGVLRTIACTHAGAGTVEAIDGLPSEAGFFPDQQAAEPTWEDYRSARESEAESRTVFLHEVRKFNSRNGRPFYRANPIVMGSWMLDGGFTHGLTIRCVSGHDSACAVATVVWMPYKARGV